MNNRGGPDREVIGTLGVQQRLRGVADEERCEREENMTVGSKFETVMDDAKDAMGISKDIGSVRDVINHPHASKFDVWVTCLVCAASSALGLLRIHKRHTSGVKDIHECSCGAKRDVLEMKYHSVQRRSW